MLKVHKVSKERKVLKGLWVHREHLAQLVHKAHQVLKASKALKVHKVLRAL